MEVFETSSTYGSMGLGFTGSNSHSFSISTSLGESFCGFNDETYRTQYISSHTLQNFSNNQTLQSISGSFVEIHRKNVANNSSAGTSNPIRRIIMPTDDPPTGELDDSPASPVPVGDVLLPLMLMTVAYAVVRWFKNWKRKHSGKRLFCIR